MKSWVIVGILLVLLGSIAHASTILVSQDPVALAIEAGNHYAKKGEYDTALEWFDKAIGLDPLSAIAHHNQGFAYHSLGRIRDAIGSFQNAIEADPSYAKAHYSLALEYYHQDHYENAMEELLKVTALEPSNAHAYFDLGVIRVKQFRAKEDANTVTQNDVDILRSAHSYYLAVVAIDPSFPNAKENAKIVENVINEYTK